MPPLRLALAPVLLFPLYLLALGYAFMGLRLTEKRATAEREREREREGRGGERATNHTLVIMR